MRRNSGARQGGARGDAPADGLVHAIDEVEDQLFAVTPADKIDLGTL